ncbi:MAG: hypothetical protein A2V70_04880 [Planctomycetes bacterium RBG_13_63_9]|nr:MAG: hypothetical protein A2V70_04880 [Planctomycetes bacterium RBG_13_63_9]
MLEQLPNLWWTLLLLGFVGGIVSGALGVGSGIVFIPVLVMFFLVPQKAAQGTALAVMVPMALLGAACYWRDPGIHISLRVVALLAAGALAGTLIGTQIAISLPANVLRKAFAVLMVVMAVRMFLMAPRRAESATEGASCSQPEITAVRGASDD